MITGDQPKTFVQRAAESAWVAAEPRLVDAITELHVEMAPAQRDLSAQAVRLAQPGAVDPVRVARHAAVASVTRALRLALTLPGAVTSGRPFTDTQNFARDSAVEAFVDQLALGGAAAAELVRLIEGGGALFPGRLRTELAKRDIRAPAIGADVVQAVLDRVFAGTSGNGAVGESAVRLVDPTPLLGTPISQAHHARTGAGRPVLARVRRPRIVRDLVTDSRLAATGALALGRVPVFGGIGPLGFIQLVMRQNLEATDLRFEALDLVELGLIVEDAGLDALVVPRPVPGLARRSAVVTERLAGVPLAEAAGRGIDRAAAVQAVVAITIEASLVHGVFWADPSPDHLLVLPDGRLGLAGVGALGRFTPEMRLAGVRTLKAVLTGDFEGMVDGMRIVGALPADADVKGLIEDLSGSPRLDLAHVLMGGEAGLLDGLNAVVGIMLAHRLQPPVEVVLLVRTIFAVGGLVHSLDPDGGAGLAGAMLPLLPRLPEIIAAAEAAVPGH